MIRFGMRIKELRKSKNLRQKDIAVIVGVTPRHYQEIEYGKINIPTLTLITLADYFDVSLDYLVGRITLRSGNFSNAYNGGFLCLISEIGSRNCAKNLILSKPQ